MASSLGRSASSALHDPDAVVRVEVVPVMTDGSAVTTIRFGDERPWVIARDGATWRMLTLEDVDEASAFVAGLLGLADPPEPPAGPATTITARAWGALARIVATRDEELSWASLVDAPVTDHRTARAMLRVAPEADDGTDRRRTVVDLIAAGIVVEYGDRLRLTGLGSGLVGSLRQALSVGGVAVDVPVAAAMARVARFTTVRTADRFFLGAWTVEEDGPRMTFGQPGRAAVGVVRGVMRVRLPDPDSLDEEADGADTSLPPLDEPGTL
ncbi:MAG: hypothetical protein R3290_01380 [Acidimicrobiia bacterium]|nr:hypothetical protein [Acidimicrobiia bacterium]